MNGSKLLVDTDIVVYFLQGNDEIVRFFSDYELVVSFISELAQERITQLNENRYALKYIN